mgnify:CR=1 FL=1
MPKRSQLNVILNPSLISKVKRDARRKGLSMSEYIAYLVTEQQSETNVNEIESLSNRISKVEGHIVNLKSNCPGQLIDSNLKPFTQEESYNCTNFMRSVFKKVIKDRNLKSYKSAWDDFLPHVERLDSWDEALTNRLKEVLLFEEPEPWSADELNRLTQRKQCPCPIREALISWSKITSIPDQQTICNQGEKLVSDLWS